MHFAFLWSDDQNHVMSEWNHEQCMPIVSKFSTRWAFISLRASQLLYHCWLWQVRGCFLHLPHFSPCKKQTVHQYNYYLGNIDIIMTKDTTSWRTLQPPYLSIRWPQREANIVQRCLLSKQQIWNRKPLPIVILCSSHQPMRIAKTTVPLSNPFVWHVQSLYWTQQTTFVSSECFKSIIFVENWCVEE